MPVAWDAQDIAGNVKISLSRDGGKAYESLVETTENDGDYEWIATGPESFNCMLKIEPVSEPDNGTVQGLFSIAGLRNAYIGAEKLSEPNRYRLMLVRVYADGSLPLSAQWSMSDPSIGAISGDIFTAQQNGWVEVATDYMGKTYKKSLFVYTTLDAMEMEANNSKETASAMLDGRFYRGGFFAGDVDFYTLTLSSAAVLDIGYLSYSLTADMRVDIYDSNDTLMAANVSENGESLVFPLGLPAGSYYVKVSDSGDIDQSNYYIVTYKILDALPAKIPAGISVGDTRDGIINHLDDTSDFAFSLSERQAIKILFSPGSGFAGYNIELLDQFESVLDSIMCLDQVPVSIEALFDPGDYTIRVGAIDDVDASRPFSVQLNNSDEQLEIENNDTSAEATHYDTTKPIKGRLSSDSDIDFYTFQLELPRFLEIAFTAPGSDKNFAIRLYKDSDQNLIDGIDIQDGEDTLLDMGLGVGRYFLSVTGDESGTDTINFYTLTIGDSSQVNLEIESNNTIKFANAIENDRTRIGRVFSGEDMDHYGFHLPDTAVFSVLFDSTSDSGDYKISLVDDNGAVFDLRSSADGQDCTLDSYKTAGNYYIKVENDGDVDQYSQYSLSLTSDATITGLKQLVSVTVAGTQAEMSVTDTQTLSATASYSDATSETVSSPIWTSLNDNVATVNEAGSVTAMGEGSTSIVASHGGLSGKYNIAIGAAPFQQHHGNLILVAGGGAEAMNTLKDSTQYLSDLVYLRYRNRLFNDEDIFYFNPVSWHDIDGDGYDNDVVDDETPTVSEFGQSITAWATNQSTDGPLYIYLIDHGGIDTFKIFPSEIMTATQLDGFVDSFQAATNRQVIVMIEACKSGSFTDDLVTSGQDRSR